MLGGYRESSCYWQEKVQSLAYHAIAEARPSRPLPETRQTRTQLDNAATVNNNGDYDAELTMRRICGVGYIL